jgi:enterochelin esterase-like enzyme
VKERQTGKRRLRSSAGDWDDSAGRGLQSLALLALLGLMIVLGPARSLAMAHRAADATASKAGGDLTSSPALDSIEVPNPLSAVGFNTPDELASLADAEADSGAVATEPPPLGRAETTEQPARSVAALVPEEVADDGVPRPMFIALPGGTIVNPERFYSQALGESRLYQVILPPGYDRTTQRYPVLYLLHGVAGGANEWVEIGIHQAAAELWNAGEIEPFIIVLPDGGPNYWLNHADGPRWGDLVAEDLVREIDSSYRTLAEPRLRAIGGLSMGADGALQLALNHPDVFSIVGAHSPSTRLSYDRIPAPFYGDESYWQEHNPLWLIQHRGSAAELNIWLDVGDGDVWLPSAQALHEALDEQGVAHEYHELPGIHDGEYWIQHQTEYLRFYDRAFHPAAVQVGELTEAAEPGELTETAPTD